MGPRVTTTVQGHHCHPKAIAKMCLCSVYLCFCIFAFVYLHFNLCICIFAFLSLYLYICICICHPKGEDMVVWCDRNTGVMLRVAAK